MSSTLGSGPQATSPIMGASMAPPMGGLMTPGAVSTTGGLLRVVPNADLMAQEEAARLERERARQDNRMEPALDDLSAFIRKRFDQMRRHRDSDAGWTNRMLDALRMFNGEYDPGKLAAIKEFGGSEIYARLVAVKCRASTAMLRDIYLSATGRPWAIAPTPNPTIPDDPREAVEELVAAEAGLAGQGAGAGVLDPTTGMPTLPPTEEEIAARKAGLEAAMEDAARKKAHSESKEAEKALDDMLVEGGFYKALSEFLTDLPLFPFAAIRGPIVYMTQTIQWEKASPGPDGKPGQAKLVKKPIARMFWRRVSPFDLWWTGGASTVEGADFIFRDRKTRSELNAMLKVPGYREDSIRAILDEYPLGYTETQDFSDAARATLESRENPAQNESGMYDLLEFHGSVHGKLLREFGMSAKDVDDETTDYSVQLWMIGKHVIKVTLSPSPRDRPPFYITSYDKVPGTLIGNAVPDMISDIQDVCNATLRALVNNIALSSGPQVVVNESLVGSGEDLTKIWPWRIWRTTSRLGSNGNADPLKFYQPASNVQQFLGVYEKFTQIADEISAIPRYVTGSERMGGAGRTASGLAMLMGNASKMLQTVASNIDSDVFEPMLQYLYDIVMLTDKEGKLRGDERIVVKGVSVAIQKETERQRQLEILAATSNPVDTGILGIRGRGAILRAVTNSLGLDGEIIVPSDEELAQREKVAQAQMVAQPPQPGMPTSGPVPGSPGQPAGVGGAPTDPSQQEAPGPIPGPRVNLQAQTPG